MLRSEFAFRLLRPSRARRSRTGASLSFALVVLMLGSVIGVGCASVTSKTADPLRDQSRPGKLNAANTTLDESGSASPSDKKDMPDNNERENIAPSPFYAALELALKRRKLKLADVCDVSDPVSRRVLEDYGAMFLTDAVVLPPPVCMFANEEAVDTFQAEAQFTPASIGGARIELQPAAMRALLAAREEAVKAGLNITPRGGSEAARRSYEDTSRLWNTRFFPALAHWNSLGRLSKEEVARLRSLPQSDQVREVLELEKKGIFFSKDFSKSILYSIAAPGTSQHIAMLALDVDQFGDARVRRILARHGWFQTVKSDLPHFTFLGLEEKDLPARGLRSVVVGNQVFWIPNVGVE
ncbi:MAG: hypothetical protein QOJ64_1077 [Acidobacteriota bacterium]|jgi:hypothetical protein|nr:hypothetical protein [Acidobacteriota bacterium]